MQENLKSYREYYIVGKTFLGKNLAHHLLFGVEIMYSILIQLPNTAQKMKFPLGISSVNVTNPTVSCVLDHIC